MLLTYFLNDFEIVPVVPIIIIIIIIVLFCMSLWMLFLRRRADVIGDFAVEWVCLRE